MLDDVDLVAGNPAKQKSCEEEDDDDDDFELDEALSRLVGIDAVKAFIMSLRNRLEVS